MPSFLDTRTSSFYPWPQGPYTIPGPPNDPFFTSPGEAYWFNEQPHRVRLPSPGNPGVTTSFVVKLGGAVMVEDALGQPVETLATEPGKLVTYTWINPVERWKQVKI